MEITLLYASLLTIMAVLLALKTGMTRGKTNTMLGNGESSELLQSIRAHGNLIENAPFVIILMGLLEMQSVADWKLHIFWLYAFLIDFTFIFIGYSCISYVRGVSIKSQKYIVYLGYFILFNYCCKKFQTF